MKKLVVVAATAGLSLTGLGAAGAQAATPAAAFKPSIVKWHACPADFVKTVHDNYDALYPVSKIVQCGELSVPLDWSKPKGQKITLQLTRTPHTAKGPAKGDIVVNPGGPGGGGALFGPRVFAQNSAPMRAAYNVIGFDPRGVGMSKPAITCDTSYSQGPRPDYGTGDRKSVKTWLAKSKGYAKACAKKYGKGSKINMLDHIKTVDVVKDVDAIRGALGRQKLDYYGASYGTYIGQVYATLFPKKVGRMVLDGNVGPSGVWYKANLSQDVAFDTNINYYFGWIAKYDSVYHLGKTQKAVRAYFYGLRNKLAKKPVFGANSDGTKTVVGSDDLTDNIQNAGYRRSQAVWHSYAAGLSAYKAGDVKALLDTFGAPTKASGVPVDDNGYAIYSGVQCTDVQWPTSWAKWQRDNTTINKKHPFLTWGNAWYNAPCLFWGAKAGKPTKIGATKNLPKNILMFQSTNDAATPYAGALELHKTLRGSHLVVQDGDRTHCIVHRGSAAVDAYFDAYFLNGKLPNKSTVHVPQLGDPTPPAAQANTLNAGQSQAAVNDVIR
ncbi:alpha/beta fold hydrolase [Actinomadura barringtoniae]|uniref:Alpha/beta fold hydrolase n=1 Tax=Actinomadura barringtoniae TaxID=1427535 RepID=A0A939P7D7_9ACTN|nr:alpha/beta hydrolase [Actinomadura barringtoniae]MBO2446820.1 alpha/beta fold hydrolase [Actinomadura barringtoniae]